MADYESDDAQSFESEADDSADTGGDVDGSPSDEATGPAVVGRAGDSLESSANNYQRGAEGERETERHLLGLPSSYHVFHSIQIGPKADIDHIVIGPTGVWVIDSKNWSSRTDVVGGRLRRNGRFDDHSIRTVEEHTAVVSRLVGVQASGVMAFAGPLTGNSPTIAGRVRVMRCDQLVEYISRTAASLNSEQIRAVAQTVANWKMRPRSRFDEIRRIRNEFRQLTPAVRPNQPHTQGARTRSGVGGVQTGKKPPSPGKRSLGGMLAALIGGGIKLTVAGFAGLFFLLLALAVFGGLIGKMIPDDTSANPEVVEVAGWSMPDTGPIDVAFRCSELNKTYWMDLHITSFSVSTVRVAVAVNGEERYLGEYRALQRIETVGNLEPGAPLALIASWDGSGGPGDLRREFTSPPQPC